MSAEHLQPTKMQCKKCNYKWIGNVLCNTEIKKAIQFMKLTICPSCGAKSKFLVIDLSKDADV